jgi:inosine/guanosine/xanthosine phosphorylase family protein
MRGRFHSYEGFDMATVTLPVRVMRLLGVKLLLVTNAAGGLNRDFNVGDIMVITDHFGLPALAGKHPLVGPNEKIFGTRFPAMSDAYDPQLRELVIQTAEEQGCSDKIRQGVYCFVSGPTYETPAECKFLATMGDAVGMSTVPEIIVAKHCGMAILGLSLITNKVLTDDDLHYRSFIDSTGSIAWRRWLGTCIPRRGPGSYQQEHTIYGGACSRPDLLGEDWTHAGASSGRPVPGKRRVPTNQATIRTLEDDWLDYYYRSSGSEHSAALQAPVNVAIALIYWYRARALITGTSL